MVPLRPRHLFIVLFIGICAVLAQPPGKLLAQENAPQESAPEKASPQERFGLGMAGGGAFPQPQDFHFRGGTLEEYIAMVNRRVDSGRRSPVTMIAPEVEDARIPPITVTYTDPVSLLDILVSLETKEFRVHHMVGQIPLYQFQPPQRETVVRSVEGILTDTDDAGRNQKLKEIISAIEAAWEIGGLAKPEPTLKYHPETALIFVSATPEQVQMVQQVLGELASEQKYLDRLSELTAQIERLKKEQTQQEPGAAAQRQTLDPTELRDGQED